MTIDPNQQNETLPDTAAPLNGIVEEYMQNSPAEVTASPENNNQFKSLGSIALRKVVEFSNRFPGTTATLLGAGVFELTNSQLGARSIPTPAALVLGGIAGAYEYRKIKKGEDNSPTD